MLLQRKGVEIYLVLSTHRELERFLLLLVNAVNSGYYRGECCLSVVFSALFNLLTRTILENICFPFSHKLTFISGQNLSCEKVPSSQSNDKAASFFSVVINIASSVYKVSFSKSLHNKLRCLNTMKFFSYLGKRQHKDLLVCSKKTLLGNFAKTSRSRQRFCFAS